MPQSYWPDIVSTCSIWKGKGLHFKHSVIGNRRFGLDVRGNVFSKRSAVISDQK